MAANTNPSLVAPDEAEPDAPAFEPVVAGVGEFAFGDRIALVRQILAIEPHLPARRAPADARGPAREPRRERGIALVQVTRARVARVGTRKEARCGRPDGAKGR